MPKQEFADGIARDNNYQIDLVYCSFDYVLDERVLLRCETPVRSGHKQVAIYAPDGDSLVLERELEKWQAREVEDPTRIGRRRFTLGHQDDRNRVYIAGVYVLSFAERIPSGLRLILASPEPVEIERYHHEKVRNPRGFLESLRASAQRG